MLSSALYQTGQLRHPSTRIPTVCVVDPQAEDYRGWDDLGDAQGVQLRIVASADEALRFSRTAAVDLWVVNVVLPGLSGTELCSMIRSRGGSAPVYLVADKYSSEAERAVWANRGTLFAVKPTHTAAFRHWVEAHQASKARTVRHQRDGSTVIVGRNS
jgi:DNA-binding response OmpR family regulator